MGIRASELAKELGVTQGRVSQMVSAGKLDGCFTGQGTGRRFDLVKVAEVLGRRLDPGQMMGNGAETRRRLALLGETVPDEEEAEAPAAPQPNGAGARELGRGDPDRYELARTQKAEEEARRLRRQNAQDEGTYVLASEVERQVARQIGQEIAEFESVLREGARRVADRCGIDFKSVRQIMVETWREHRGGRAEALEAAADAPRLTDAERASDI